MHGRAVDALEGGAPAALELLERPHVQIFEQVGDGFVELGEAEELAVAQVPQDPTLRDLHTDLDLGLVARLSRASGNNRRVVVPGKLEERRIDLGVVAIGSCHRAFELIRHEYLRDGAEVLEARMVEPMKSPRLCVSVASAYV